MVFFVYASCDQRMYSQGKASLVKWSKYWLQKEARIEKFPKHAIIQAFSFLLRFVTSQQMELIILSLSLSFTFIFPSFLHLSHPILFTLPTPELHTSQQDPKILSNHYSISLPIRNTIILANYTATQLSPNTPQPPTSPNTFALHLFSKSK